MRRNASFFADEIVVQCGGDVEDVIADRDSDPARFSFAVGREDPEWQILDGKIRRAAGALDPRSSRRLFDGHTGAGMDTGYGSSSTGSRKEQEPNDVAPRARKLLISPASTEWLRQRM